MRRAVVRLRRVRGTLGGLLTALAATLVAGGGALRAGQAPAGQEPPPTFRSAVEAVQLSVIVTDSEGRPVSGLTQDDFEILENGAARSITTFSAVDVPIERTEQALGERDVLSNDGPQGRLYVIALDQMSSLSALRARAILRRFIESYFGRNDTAAVVLTTGGPRDSGQEFTSNARLLTDAINKFDGGTYDSDEKLREKNFIGDFKNLMQFMATLRGGRKAVIFVSEGIPVDAYQVVEHRGGFGLFSDVDTGFVEALSFATRNNIAIYPIDPRGLTTGVSGESEDGSSGPNQATQEDRLAALDDRLILGGLAAVTGGFTMVGSNNYSQAFERLVRENSTYYLLGFNSGIDTRDGRYVPIDVRVKRPGLQVRSTDGYVSPRGRPQRVRRPSTVLAATWDAVASAITTSGVPMRMYAAPFKGKKKDDATVPITLEIDAARLNLVEEDGAHRGQLEVVFAVTDVTRKRWPIWRHRWGLSLKPETYERVSKGGAMRVISQLTLPKGRYQLRASAGGAALAGSVVYDLEIPDFTDDFSLSGVALASTHTEETFTFSPDKRIDVTLPAAPTTAREFSRDDTLTIFAEAYEDRKKAHTVTFTLELRDEADKVIGTYAMQRVAKEKPKQASVYAFAPTLALEDVPAGRYVLRVDGHSSLDNKNKRVVREIPFTVR